MSPNRLAIVAGILQAIAATVLAILHAVTTPLQAIVLCVAVVAITALIIVFLIGWQRYEARQADVGKPTSPFPDLSQAIADVGALADKAHGVMKALEPALPILERLSTPLATTSPVATPPPAIAPFFPITPAGAPVYTVPPISTEAGTSSVVPAAPDDGTVA